MELLRISVGVIDHQRRQLWVKAACSDSPNSAATWVMGMCVPVR